MLKIHKGVRRPELAMKLFASNELSGVLEETHQNLDRLPFQPDLAALLLQLARTQIKLEDAEANHTRGWYCWAHLLIRTESNTSRGTRIAPKFMSSGCGTGVESEISGVTSAPLTLHLVCIDPTETSRHTLTRLQTH